MPRNRGFGESAEPSPARDPKLASEKQVAFIHRLLDEKDLRASTKPALKSALNNPTEGYPKVIANMKEKASSLTKQQASAWIETLLTFPRIEQPSTTQALEPGVYETSEGIFVVKFNRAKTNLYAKKMVEINAERATESGERVEIEFDYAAGAIRRIKPEDKMPLERAKALTIRYGRCINCGRYLKAAESVERGIGPVCIKSFGG